MRDANPSPGLSVGTQYFTADQVFELLHQYQLVPLLHREIITDQAIQDIALSDTEEQTVLQHLEQVASVTPGAVVTDQLRSRELRKARIEALKQQMWGNKLEEYFLGRKAQLDRAVYYLLRHRDHSVCQELFFRLQEGEESFANLVPLYSNGTEIHTKGLVGPVEMGKLHPNLAQQLRTSQPEQLLPPIKLGDWWVIIELVEWIPAQLDDALRQRLLTECFEQWLQVQLQALQVT